MYRMGKEELEELRRVIESKLLSRIGDDAPGHLREVSSFEEEWSAKTGVKYSICMSGGGTAALICGLAGMGIGPGDEVLVPAYTWMASATSVLAVGAIPVFVEVDETLAIDPEDVGAKISPQTQAIIPVHMCGRPANMERLTEIARKHSIQILEDACQADGGSYQGRRLGAWGHAGAFSFNYYKIIACGEGGALVTNNREIFERAFIYHDSGTVFRPGAGLFNTPIFVAQQYRASEIMGAVLRIQLQRLDGILADLRRIKKAFEVALNGVSGLKVAPNNDLDGDCGVVAAFQFQDEKSARGFAKASGVEGWLPIDSGKHVYSNWDPVLGKNFGHCDAVNPFLHPKNARLRQNYAPDMCPRTLDVLRRTVFININPDWSESEVDKRIAACNKAAKTVRTAAHV